MKSRDGTRMMQMTSGGTVMAAFWVPLMVVFSCMTLIDTSPVVFFLLAGVATTYVNIFLPELAGTS